MNITKHNILYFRKYYRLMALAMVVATAVISGSLMVGDSVRQTLLDRVGERLGSTQTIIVSPSSFLDSTLAPKNGLLMSNGFVKQSGRLLPVTVWGRVDIVRGQAFVNEKLDKETDPEIVLRLPSTGIVPSGSIFVTDNYTSSLMLTKSGIKAKTDGGNINLRNEQSIPLNIFVNREELAQAMGVNGKINTIFYDSILCELGEWAPHSSGFKLNGSELTTDRIFIQSQVVDAITGTNPQANRLFSYLVNSIDSLPYSFVTAMEKYRGESLSNDEIILSDYAADRLGVRLGARIAITYYTSSDLKTLKIDTSHFTVSRIVPLAELHSDTTLSARFPGLTDVESCTDWNSDIPIDMNRITKEDEAYWDKYNTTPKAIIAYDAVVQKWSNDYGSATAIRGVSNIDCLTPRMVGIEIINPQQMGLKAAGAGVDFSSLFLSLGFFIVAAALLLMSLPISQMLHHRSGEIELYGSLGFTNRTIKRMLLREAMPVLLASSIVGLVVAVIYTQCVLWLLGTLWQGATQTDGFTLSINPVSIIIGTLATLALATVVIIRIRTRSRDRNSVKPQRLSWRMSLIILSSVGVVITLILGLFIATGVMMILVAISTFDYLIVRRSAESTLTLEKSVWVTLNSQKRGVMTSFLTLTLGLFTVFSVGLNRPVFDSEDVGTGGFDLWCENTVPIYHNLSTKEGRERLSLGELSDSVEIRQILRHGADDASCLNLNRAPQPTVLGIDMEHSGFEFAQTLDNVSRGELFTMLRSTADSSVVPVVADATVLMWSLGKQVGDTMHYSPTLTVRFIGAVKNSIFQGNIIMSPENFKQHWKETTGSERMLIKTGTPAQTRQLLERALSDYGVTVSTTTERLAEFATVTDTYLSIFLVLGALGMLLGMVAFVVVVRKNLAIRSVEIEIYRTLGYTQEQTTKILTKESSIVPHYALVAALLSAIVGSAGSFSAISPGVWLVIAIFVVLFLLIARLFISESVRQNTFR